MKSILLDCEVSMYSRSQCTTTYQEPGPAVLSVSRSRSLLLTRKAVLGRAGFTVNAVTSYKEAVSITHNARPVVAILDQTIPWREREKLAIALKNAYLPIRVVEIAMGTDPCPLQSVDGIVGSLEGPEVLVAAVREAIAAKKPCRTGAFSLALPVPARAADEPHAGRPTTALD